MSLPRYFFDVYSLARFTADGAFVDEQVLGLDEATEFMTEYETAEKRITRDELSKRTMYVIDEGDLQLRLTIERA